MADRYIAVLTPEKDGGYSVAFPDCPGCATEGDTIDEAISAAAEALEGWVESMRETGQEIAPPRKPEAIARKVKRGELLVLISAPPPPARAVPVTITVPENLLQLIDSGAKAAGTNRSAFMAKHSAIAAASWSVPSARIVGTVGSGERVLPVPASTMPQGKSGRVLARVRSLARDTETGRLIEKTPKIGIQTAKERAYKVPTSKVLTAHGKK